MKNLKMKKRVKFLILLFNIFFFQIVTYADRGAIIPYPIKVSESAQKAIILHNKKEEVLILGTDIEAENEAEILEFIPLPSKPKIFLVNKDVFKNASYLMKKYNVVFLMQYKAMGAGTRRPAIEIRLHKKIGAHDITVIKINNISFFRNWVNNFFKKKGLPQKKKYPFIEEIANNYVSRNIKYFVFDFIKVTKKLRSVAPLAYRFKSNKIYYPLITSNSFGGGSSLKPVSMISEHGIETSIFYKSTNEIDLIFITPKILFKPRFGFYGSIHIPNNNKFIELPKPVNGAKGYWDISTYAYLPKEEIKTIYPKSNEFFKDNRQLIMQFVRYKGIYNFNKDIYYKFRN